MYNKTQLKQMNAIVNKWFKNGGYQPRSQEKDTILKENCGYVSDDCVCLVKTTNKELGHALNGCSVLGNPIEFKHSAIIDRKRLIEALKLLKNDRIVINLGDGVFPISVEDKPDFKDAETTIIIAPCTEVD